MNVEREFEFVDYKPIFQPKYDLRKVKKEVIDNDEGGYVSKSFPPFSDHFDSWNSKIWAIEQVDMRIRYPNDTRGRVGILQELYDTERAYVIYLATIEELFIPKLRASQVVTNKQSRVLFGDIPSLYQTNQMLLDALRILPPHEAFMQLLPFLKLYSTYAAQYPSSLKTYAELNSKESFRNALATIEADSRCQGHRLSALLIMPVQRIPRYILLIEKLMDNSTGPRERRALINVMNEMKKLSQNMQMCMMTYESGERLLRIQESFGLERHIFEPGRTLIRDGILYKRDMHGSAVFQERIFFLFNDVLLYGKKRISVGVGPIARSRYEPSCMLFLRHCEIDHNDIEGSIHLKCDDVRLVITADTFDTVKEWYETLTTAVRRAKTLRTTLRKQSSRKVHYFERGFWGRKKGAFKSFYLSDIGSTVQRVFSKREPLQKERDFDFLQGCRSTYERKRKLEATPEAREDEEILLKRPNIGELKIVIEEQFEDRDEMDRKPRVCSQTRSNLAIADIRKLSYQHNDLFDLDEEKGSDSDDKDDDGDVCLKPASPKAPWWANESAPAVIKNQPTGIVNSIRSKCALM